MRKMEGYDASLLLQKLEVIGLPNYLLAKLWLVLKGVGWLYPLGELKFLTCLGVSLELIILYGDKRIAICM